MIRSKFENGYEISDTFLTQHMPHIIENFWNSFSKKANLTQLQRYEQNGSPEYVRRFIALGGGPRMGTTLEEFARFKFKILKTRGGGVNTGLDHMYTVNDKTVYVEQKSSGYWRNNKKDDFKWQHIEVKHKWNMLLLCGIEYQDIKFWAMNRKTFDTLVSENKITNQGNKKKDSSEGMWVWYSVAKDYLTPIESDEDLQKFAESI
jgi:hypothetical protein